MGSEPVAVLAWFEKLRLDLARIYLEAGSLSMALRGDARHGTFGRAAGDAARSRWLQGNTREDGSSRCPGALCN